METVKGVFDALVELVGKLVSDNDQLKKILDTVKEIFAKLTDGKTENSAA